MVSAGLEDVGQHDVVESDVGDPAAQPGAPQCAQRADRDEVLAGEQGRGRLRQLEHGPRLLLSLLAGGQVLADQLIETPRPAARSAARYPAWRSRAVLTSARSPRYAIRR